MNYFNVLSDSSARVTLVGFAIIAANAATLCFSQGIGVPGVPVSPMRSGAHAMGPGLNTPGHLNPSLRGSSGQSGQFPGRVANGTNRNPSRNFAGMPTNAGGFRAGAGGGGIARNSQGIVGQSTAVPFARKPQRR